MAYSYILQLSYSQI